MNETPLSVLDRLLAQPPGDQLPYCLRFSRDNFRSDLTDTEMEQIEAEYSREFWELAAQVAATWGLPDFIGHRNESPYTDHWAEEFCYWRRENLLAMLWWEHQDKEVPVALMAGVMTEDELLG